MTIPRHNGASGNLYLPAEVRCKHCGGSLDQMSELPGVCNVCLLENYEACKWCARWIDPDHMDYHLAWGECDEYDAVAGGGDANG